ncbi:MAG TPA: hypothetical protein VIQ54_16240 [Polyangia bacterium]|jgi:hypothetical protein
MGALHRIILAGTLLVAGCSGGAGACRPITEENLIPVSPELPDAATGDGGLENLLVLCEADMSNCTRLCEAAIPRSPGSYDLDECQLTRVDGGFAVHVVYHWRQCLG